MNLPAIIPLACALLLLLHLNVSSVESSRPQALGKGHHQPGHGHHDHNGHDGDGGQQPDHPDGYNGYSFYMFGDSFADAGNLVKMNPPTELNRQWHTPYGSGRFSNSLVQSDLIAFMLGQKKSPPAHRLTRDVGRAGLNFAAGGSGVFDVPGTLSLSRQVHTFQKLLKDGDIDADHLPEKSVALVAISGNDYILGLPADPKSFAEMDDFANKVTAEIVVNVVRLQNLGVQKVLVNNLYPFGCVPSQTRAYNHTRCDERRNLAATLHNHHLANKLADLDGVLVVDLNAAFSTVVRHYNDDGGGDIAHLFREKLAPCCESTDPKGYCGQVDPDTLEPVYQVCDDPNLYFFWDEMNPTMVGWQAVMGPLDHPIRKFLGLTK